MSNRMNIRQLSHNQIAVDKGNQTYYIRNRGGIIEGRRAGQGYFTRHGYINPSRSSQNVKLTLPSFFNGK